MNYDEFLSRISSVISEDRIYTDDLRTFCWGTDAGFYRMTPRIVIRAKDENEISCILREAGALNLPVTFRAAGTSLSGQAISDSILVVCGKNWEDFTIADNGATITLQPGLVGAQVNRILRPYGRKFGPDPASIGSSMVGGIVNNNASGMSCGTWANSDRMMISARMVLPDGTILDTGSESSREAFRKSHPEFLRRISELRDRVLSDEALTARIRYKYSIKNVTGLNLLPLVTFEDPFDIIAHTLVGSEGTLAFLSSVTMKTLPIAPFSASAMIYFRDIRDAARAVVAVKPLPVSAAELLDSRSLASVKDTTGEGLTAVLMQTEAGSQEELDANIASISSALSAFDTVTGVRFSQDPEECASYWAIRSGIFPTVGGMRAEGTTCLIEDIAFHIENLPEATADLSDLLDRHKYEDSCIYGHALEGNFHFIINQSFDTEAEVARYEAMIRDVASMVIGKYDGSLKAEHGTGRNMAPFVSYEWGEEAFAVMKELKSVFDPSSILNPGVIFNDDPLCFIRNFKALPRLDFGERINKCIECGFCEVNCLSCGLTLSSRTRIAAQREMEALRCSGKDPERLSRLEKLYRYYGNETCAADGLCSTSCPMGISVADMTHELRARQSTAAAHRIGAFAAHNMPAVKSGVRAVLDLASFGNRLLGDKAMNQVCGELHKVGVPLWTTSFPRSYRMKVQPSVKDNDLKVVYIPSCINQTMGLQKNAPVSRPLVEETVALLEKAGYSVIFPEGREKLCCGTIWESKGQPDIADEKTREMEAALWEASEHGKYPVLCDQSPCLHRMREKISSMHLYEPAEFIWKFLRDKLEFHRTDEPVAIHQTCTMRLMGLAGTLYDLASLCSSSVLVPEGVGCCGFAGDKGMTNPELNAYALRKLRSQISKAGIKVGYSNSRTCEIGLQTNSGIPYVSIVYLVNAHTDSLGSSDKVQNL